LKLEEVAETLEVSKGLISQGWICANDGLVSVDEDGKLCVTMKSTTKKEWPWIKKRLSFMVLSYTKEETDSIAKTVSMSGEFILDRLPTSDEAETIRKEVGLRKSKIALTETKPKTGT